MNEEFLGFQRPNGMVGIRNKIAVISSVVCVNTVVRSIANKVDNAVAIVHPLGCGQIGQDFLNTIGILSGLASNPNIYGTLLVGLGCENLTIKRISRKIDKTQNIESFNVQDIKGGTPRAIEKGIKICKRLSEEARGLKREYFDFSYLNLGLECGGSDSISGITANPAVGIISDKIVKMGGASILPEFTE
ncbi:MAG: UxaA family hydrolase, partial [Promethearchaeota archaeon]